MQANPALVTSRLGGPTRTTLALGSAAGYVSRGLTLPTAEGPTHSSVRVLAGAGGPAVGYTTMQSATQTGGGSGARGTSSAARTWQCPDGSSAGRLGPGDVKQLLKKEHRS
jgi:hypothetical protein